jgi:hypothetical protein
MAPRQITVGDIIAEHGRSYPGQLALADGQHHLTWPELGRGSTGWPTRC